MSNLLNEGTAPSSLPPVACGQEDEFLQNGPNVSTPFEFMDREVAALQLSGGVPVTATEATVGFQGLINVEIAVPF